LGEFHFFVESEFMQQSSYQRSFLLALRVFTVGVLLCHTLEAQENWSQFRGPHGDGHASLAKLPVKWSETENIAWKTAIPGKAWSSPVVEGNKIWMTSATPDGKRLSAICVDGKSGKIESDIAVFEIEKPMFCYPYNSYASSTPVIEDGKLYVHFGSAGTACLETSTGKTLWSRQDLPCDHHRGPGSSPILHDDLLIVHFDGFDLQYVVAVNKTTGKTVWKTDRDINYATDNGDAKKAYGTPLVIVHDGRKQLISPAAVATTSYDPETGVQLWRVYHGGYNAATRPIYAHGLVIINLEGGMRLLAVRPDGTGDVTETHVAWTYKKATPTRPSQLVIGDHLYMVNDKGIFTCLDYKTGEATWTERIGGAHSTSLIYANGNVYCFDEQGVSYVIAADNSKFRLVAQNTLDSGCMASPAVLGDALILRTKTHLYRIENANVESPGAR